MIVVDPLDRIKDPEKYPAMDSDKVLSVQELQDKISKTDFLQGGNDLQAALSKDTYNEFMSQIDNEFKNICDIATEYSSSVKKYGTILKM